MSPDKEMSLGEFLRQEREARCITIEQVASATKVGVRTLHALEGDRYSELPARPFVRGFVTSYCRFVGLDPKEVLAKYEDFIHQKGSERPNREGGHSGYVFERKEGEQQGRTVLVFAIFGFVLVGGLAMLLLKPSLHHHRRSHLEKLRDAHEPVLEAGLIPNALPSGEPLLVNVSQTLGTSPTSGPTLLTTPIVNATPVPPATPISTPTPTPPPTSVAPVGGASIGASPEIGMNPTDPLDSGHDLSAGETQHKLIFKILGDTWVRYQVDGRPMRKFIMRKGKSLYLKGHDAIKVQASHPNHVSSSYNGDPYILMSQRKDLLQKGNATLFFPKHLAEKIDKPFGEEKNLSQVLKPSPEIKKPAPGENEGL